MSEESGSKQFHINIMSDATSKERVEKASNQSETYILIANEQLSNRVRELEAELSELRQENDTLTDENERMEKSITYQRGLLHNFDEMNQVRSNLVKILTVYLSSYRSNCKEIKETAIKTSEFRKQLYYMYGLVFTLVTAIGLIDIVNSIFMISLVFGTYYLSIFVFSIDRSSLNMIKMFKRHENSYSTSETEIKDKRRELTDLEKNNNHIGEFIDNI